MQSFRQCAQQRGSVVWFRCSCDDKQSETEQISWPRRVMYQDVSKATAWKM